MSEYFISETSEGFGLWELKRGRVYRDRHLFGDNWDRFTVGESQTYEFIQKLSLNLEDSKKMSLDVTKGIEPTLNGNPEFLNEFKNFYNYVEKWPVGRFKTGLYSQHEICRIVDAKYLAWALDRAEGLQAELIEKRLRELKYYIPHNWTEVLEDGSQVERTEIRTDILEKQIRKNFVDGHHFKDRDRLDLELFFLESFAFMGKWGKVFIQKFYTGFAQGVIYKGTKPPLDPDSEINTRIKVKATISHGYYKDVGQTYIKNLKVLNNQ